MTTLGIWSDGGPRELLPHLHELPELGLTTVAIMVETSRAAWDPVWTPAQVGEVCARARELDLEVVLTIWPVPRRAYIDVMIGWLELACGLGVAAIEGDLEGGRPEGQPPWGWCAAMLDGSIPSLADAAALLLLRLRSLAAAHDLRLEVTSHTGHAETSPRALVAPHVDRLVAQAYSIRRRPGGQVVEWDDEQLGPGQHQHWAARDARTVPGVRGGQVDLSLGLALWSQHWPGHEPAEALGLAYQAAVDEDPVEIRWWSLRHLVERPYARAWLRALAAARRTP